VPEGTGESPCPGGYKYGGLALQVGGWATGRQAGTLKKKLLGNLKYGQNRRRKYVQRDINTLRTGDAGLRF